jgi:type II secretory pathway predicted ATPase ExeA
MYLEHFGFTEEPFSPHSVPDVFFEGANRGATLDSLIYTLTHGEGEEGIVEVTGPSGSGKTYICHLMMNRLPRHMQSVYIDNLNVSKEDFACSLAEKLNLEPVGEPEGAGLSAACLEQLSTALVEKCTFGAQYVLLIDETHSASPEMLEEVRLFYDLLSPHGKLLQVVLLGEASLDRLLASPQLHSLKSRITHHLFLQPVTPSSLKDYLLQRLRVTGYHGPNIFAPSALRLIASASSGVIERINILADKSLDAAFRDNTKSVMPEHVKSAIRDSGLGHDRNWPPSAKLIAGGSLIAVVIAGFSIDEFVRQPTHSTPNHDISRDVPVYSETPSPAPLSTPLIAATPTYNTVPAPAPAIAASPASSTPPAPSTPPPAHQSNLSPKSMTPATVHDEAQATDTPARDNSATTTGQKRGAKSAVAGVKLADYPLLQERVNATAKMLGTTDRQHFTIQLFSTDNIQGDRMERFLSRAQSLVSLSDIYVYPITVAGQAKFRVAYGVYLTRRQADTAASDLPQKYQEAFHFEVYTLDELQ